MFDSMVVWLKLVINKLIFFKFRFLSPLVFLQSGVKVNKDSCLEGPVKIYANTSIIKSSVGRGSYIAWGCVLDNCSIGRFCSIAPFTQVIYGQHPVSDFVSSHPAFYSTQKQAGFSFVTENKFNEFTYADEINKKSVVIGNDVWIGFGVKILEGVTVGDGAIIGANSLVTKDVEPYSVCMGLPAKKLKMRFEPGVVKKLLSLLWWEKDLSWVEEKAEFFSDPLALIKELESE